MYLACCLGFVFQWIFSVLPTEGGWFWDPASTYQQNHRVVFIGLHNKYGVYRWTDDSVLRSGGVELRPLGYERMYLPLCKVADTPFHIQVDDLSLLITKPKGSICLLLQVSRCCILAFQGRLILSTYSLDIKVYNVGFI